MFGRKSRDIQNHTIQALYKECTPGIHCHLQKRFGLSLEDREELIHEAFIALLKEQNMPTIPCQWLRRAAYNRAVDRWRRPSAEEETGHEWGTVEQAPEWGYDSFQEEALEFQERDECLQSKVRSRLTAQCTDILDLVVWLGLGSSEIAQWQGTRLATARNRLSDCKHAIEKLFARYCEEPTETGEPI